ncbi:MAG: type II secretion system major pseudopilin GspG [Gammaproteobacteria bacterium]|nr:type II secretion system major pseudopilin GspG [Gammaproteobacteria bacterium]
MQRVSNIISRGFTLIEVMVVVVILGILAAMVVPKIMSRPDQAKIVKAQQDVMAIQSALDLYKLDNGFYPTTDQGLQALSTKPDSDPVPQSWKAGGYLQSLPIDPWNKPYQYLNPGVHGDVDVFSYGPTGKAGAGEIGNWNSSGQQSSGTTTTSN